MKFFMLFIFLMATSVLVPTCPPQIQAESVDALVHALPEIDAALEECPVRLPPVISAVYRNADVVLNVSEVQNVAVRIEGGKLTDILNTTENPDFVVHSDKQTVNAMLQDEKPHVAFMDAYGNGSMTVEPYSTPNRVRLWMLDTAVKIRGLFS